MPGSRLAAGCSDAWSSCFRFFAGAEEEAELPVTDQRMWSLTLTFPVTSVLMQGVNFELLERLGYPMTGAGP